MIGAQALKMGWVWDGFGMGLGWVWVGFGLCFWVGFGLGHVWVGFGLGYKSLLFNRL